MVSYIELCHMTCVEISVKALSGGHFSRTLHIWRMVHRIFLPDANERWDSMMAGTLKISFPSGSLIMAGLSDGKCLRSTRWSTLPQDLRRAWLSPFGLALLTSRAQCSTSERRIPYFCQIRVNFDVFTYKVLD